MTRLALLLALMGCKKPAATPLAGPVPAEASAAQPGPAQALKQFFDRIHAERLALDPIRAAYLGAPHDETRWTPIGEAQWEAERSADARALEELAAFPLEALPPEDQLSVRLFQIETERRLRAYEWRHHSYLMTHISGTHTWVPAFLMTVHRIDDAQSAKTWIARVRNAAGLFDQVVAELQVQRGLGIRAPAYCYPMMLEAIDNLRTGAPFDEGPASPLLAHFEQAVAELELPEEQAAALRAEAISALKDDLGPAYTRLAAQLATDAEDTTDNHGAWSLPDGAAYYTFRLEGATTTDLGAEAIHQIGLDEVARIQGEMRALMPALGVEGDLSDLYRHLRESPEYTLPDDAKGREAYLELARGYVTGMRAVLPENFEHLPSQPLQVRRVEEWREGGAGKAFYQSPSPDGARPGIFYANLSRMEDMPTYQLEALVYHEGIPGHHMQNAVSQRLDSLPPFRRFGHYTAYGEGWGLYSEYLPKELGFYQEPANDVGRLAMELWRAARLVVDTGMHHERWTREQAIEYLVTETPNPRGDAVKAIERYMVWPGQATAYKIGMLEILRLREDAKARLGDQFELRGFHGVVLGTGPVPLPVLAEQVDAWVASKEP